MPKTLTIKSDGGLFFIHSETQTGRITVKFAQSRAVEAQYEGKYKYFIRSYEELVSLQLPSSILLGILNINNPRSPVRLVKNRERTERKVWRIMSVITSDEQKLAASEEKAKKKISAEERKQAAADKKAAAEKAAADAKAAKAQAAADAKAAKAKAAAEAKAAKAAKVKTTNAPTSRIGRDEVVRLLVDKNPKRPGSASYPRFELYKDGITVGDFIKAGGTMADVVWDFGHRLITLEPPAEPKIAGEEVSEASA